MQFPISLRIFIRFTRVTGEERVMADFLLSNIILTLVHKH
jgi:hypothetical protein